MLMSYTVWQIRSVVQSLGDSISITPEATGTAVTAVL